MKYGILEKIKINQNNFKKEKRIRWENYYSF